MKKILLLLMLSLSLTSFAQSEAVIDSVGESIESVEADVDQTVTTTERILDKYSGKAYDAIKELATAMQVPAEYVYTILVKQAVVNSITYLFIYIIIFGIIYAGIRLVKKEIETDRDYGDDPFHGVVGAILLIVGFFGLVFVCTTMATTVGGFINPEYYAIQEILDTFRK